MAVTLIGTTPGDQGLFNRLGAIGAKLIDCDAARQAIDAAPADVLELYDGDDTATRESVDGLIAAAYLQSTQMSTWPAGLREAAVATTTQAVDDDAPLAARTAQNALEAIVKQMRTATTSYVVPNTVSAAVTQTGLTGNGVVVASVKDGRGYGLENLLAERLRLRCTDADVAGSSRIQVDGEAAEPSKLSHNWPKGSGSSKGFTTVDAAGADNLVTNGTFETFTVANTPDGWTITVGTAGTNVFSEASVVFAGTKALKITGNGSTLTQIRQLLTSLESLTPYGLNFWAKMVSAPSTGILVCDLYDGTSVINDEAGTPNSFEVDLVTLGTTYVPKSGVFRLPEPVPATVYLRIYQKTANALENAKSLLIDHLAMTPMEQCSNDLGATPYVTVFNGSVDFSTDDGHPELTNTFKIETSNDRVSDWQELIDRIFDSSRLGITLPTSGTTLIDDALIA